MILARTLLLENDPHIWTGGFSLVNEKYPHIGGDLLSKSDDPSFMGRKRVVMS
jgi:hypothetical protein